MVAVFGVMTLPRFAPMLVGGLPVTGNVEGWRMPADLGANAVRAILAWVGQPDVSPFWLSEGHLLEWGALLVFGIGMLMSLRRWRDSRYAVLGAWVTLTTVFGGVIWTAAPLYVRYMTAVPAIALLVGVGLEQIKSVTQRHKGTETQRKEEKGEIWGRYGGWVMGLVVVVVCGQGMIAALGHIEEGLGRVSESQWVENGLAWEARLLDEGVGALLVLPADFGAVQRITIADYVAAYGERRAVAVSQGGEDAEAQGARLGGDYAVVRLDE